MLNQNIILERSSQYKALKILIVILLSAMVAIPVGLFMNTQHANDSVTYRWQGESVSFNGNNVVIGFGNHLYPVPWTITKLFLPSGNTVSPMVSLSIPVYLASN